LQVGHFRYRQRHAGALHTDVDLGSDEVKGGIVGKGYADKDLQHHHKWAQEMNGERDLTRTTASFVTGERRVTQGIILTDLRQRSA